MFQRLVLQDHSDSDSDLVTLVVLSFESLVGLKIVRDCLQWFTFVDVLLLASVKNKGCLTSSCEW